jgi:hypothetical protein
MAKFNPKEHLMPVKGGAQYLEVKWRLVWFREEFPNGTMVTEPVEISKDIAIFKATVTAVDAEGKVRGSATGYKTCTPQQFKFGYVEKAETGALGRALACLGFGTQFEPEFDEGEQIVDSPVNQQHAPQAAQQSRSASQPPNPTPDTSQPANLDRERVMKRLHAVGKEHGIDHEGLRALVIARAAKDGVAIGSLQDASGWLLAETANAIEADPAKLKSWVAKQQELMPGIEAVPNVSKSPTYN